MSYGWLTESALPPKPGKPIAVRSGSLGALKALVYKGEQEAKLRRAKAPPPAGSTSVLSKPTRRAPTRDEVVMAGQNEGVGLRNGKDHELVEAAAQDYATVRRRLEEKAKLYRAKLSAAARGKFEDDEEEDDGAAAAVAAESVTRWGGAAWGKHRGLSSSLVDFGQKAKEAENLAELRGPPPPPNEERGGGGLAAAAEMTPRGGSGAASPQRGAVAAVSSDAVLAELAGVGRQLLDAKGREAAAQLTAETEAARSEAAERSKRSRAALFEELADLKAKRQRRAAAVAGASESTVATDAAA